MASLTTGVGGLTEQNTRNAFTKLQTALDNFALNSGGLAIKAAASALAKTVSTVNFRVDGKVYQKAAADMAALAGTVTNAKFNVYVHYVNAAGTVSTLMGTEAATLGAVAFPTAVAGTAMIGYTIVNPTGTGNFVGGTTALDDATVVPNAVYVNTPFPMDFAVNAL